ncbi:MAG: peptidylprolyl isomerase [Myxococcota bacterium]
MPTHRARRAGEILLTVTPPAQDPSRRRTTWLLFAGTALGLALAASGLVEPGREGAPLPPDVAAIVGDEAIRRIDYERMLAGVGQDRRGPIDAATRRRVLERMIDEALLVQQALSLGLAAADRRVRGELVSGLVDSIVAEADHAPPSPDDVDRHYRSQLDFFTRPGRQRVESLLFSRRRDSARARAENARARLMEGATPDAVERGLGDAQVASLPADLLPIAKLRDYLGPAVIDALGGLAVGVWSEPIETAEGFRLVRVVEREPEQTPPLAEIEGIVRRDLVRRRGDEALRDYLDALRDQTPIVYNEALLEPAPTTGDAPRPGDAAASEAGAGNHDASTHPEERAGR